MTTIYSQADEVLGFLARSRAAETTAIGQPGTQTTANWADAVALDAEGCNSYEFHLFNNDTGGTITYQVQKSLDNVNWVSEVASSTLAAATAGTPVKPTSVAISGEISGARYYRLQVEDGTATTASFLASGAAKR